jgi:glucose-6-phosphate isomerase
LTITGPAAVANGVNLELLTLGETMDINAFDQPGIEAVKKVPLGTLGDTRYKDQALNQP